jgi:hypothetical protein
MTNPRAAILIATFPRESYPALRAAMVDGARLPPTWDEWSARTDAYCEALRAAGAVVRLVAFDLAAFLEWTATRRLAPDAMARTEWVALCAHREDRAPAGRQRRARNGASCG